MKIHRIKIVFLLLFFSSFNGVKAENLLNESMFAAESCDSPVGDLRNAEIPSWKFKASGTIRGIATSSQRGEVYFGSTNCFAYCLDLKGNLKWNYNAGGRIHRLAYDNNLGQIYFRTHQGSLICISDKGKFLWKYVTGNLHGIDIDSYTGYIYCVLHEKSKILCIGPDGDLKWEKKVQDAKGGGLALNCKKKLIYVSFHGGALFCLDYSGNVQWQHNLDRIDDISVDKMTGDIFCASHDGNIYCLNEDGDAIWQYDTEDYNGGIVVDHVLRKVYIISTHNIYCFSVDGWLLGKYAVKNIEAWASIAVNPATGNVYFGTTDGHLYSLPPVHCHEDKNTWDKLTQVENRLKKVEELLGL